MIWKKKMEKEQRIKIQVKDQICTPSPGVLTKWDETKVSVSVKIILCSNKYNLFSNISRHKDDVLEKEDSNANDCKIK